MTPQWGLQPSGPARSTDDGGRLDPDKDAEAEAAVTVTVTVTAVR
ncbi:hypothetical protein ACFVT6_38775 [Streptomyces sp. NPDC058049]